VASAAAPESRFPNPESPPASQIPRHPDPHPRAARIGAGGDAEGGADLARLRAVNEALWDIEDRIRLKEKAKAFDAEFIELARSVYIRNDERAAIKREINQKLGSTLVEEKSYQEYR
jgi:hypothetical protein